MGTLAHIEEVDAEQAGLLHVRCLGGQRFRVLTDHQSLQHFRTQPLLSNRQSRWKDVIANFDFDIVYIEGKTNTVADALSRRRDHMPHHTVSATRIGFA
mgnify:CR=1 FL=1